MTPPTFPPDIIAALEELRRSLDPATLETAIQKCGNVNDALTVTWQLRAPELATLSFPGMTTDDAPTKAAGLRRLDLTAKFIASGGDPVAAGKAAEGIIYRELARIPTGLIPSTCEPLCYMPPPTPEEFLVYGLWVMHGISAWIAWGGAGKGCMGAGAVYALATGAPTFAGQRIHDPHPRRILIVDFEHHFYEWYLRIKACGPATANIFYLEATGRMDVEGPRIAQAVAENSIDAALIDSAIYAIPAGMNFKDVDAPLAVCDPLNTLGIPVLIFGHPTYATKDDPKDILGSSFWQHEFRLARGIVKQKDEPHTVRFNPSKRSTGPTLPRLTFQIDGHTSGLTVTCVENTAESGTGTTTLILDALREKGTMTVDELATTTDREEDTIRKELRKLQRPATGRGPRIKKNGKRNRHDLYQLAEGPTLELVPDRDRDTVNGRIAHDIGEDAWRPAAALGMTG